MTQPPPITAAALCALFGTTAPDDIAATVITGISTLDRATPTEVSFVTKERYVADALASKAALLIVPRGLVIDGRPSVAVDEVMLAVIRIIEHFHPTRPARVGIHPTAVVDATATIGEGTEIGPKVVIEAGARVGARTRIEAGCFIGEGVEIGEDCWLSPNVTVLTGSHLGRRVRVYPGAVIGADGFRFEVLGGRLRKIPQVGRVVIEDDVEIGANATIDRAFLTETRIGARTKMDNAVHIAHNVEVGSDCILVAQVAIAGSTKVGRGVQVGGAAVMKDHITVGDGARIGGRAGVQSNLPPRAQVMGTPALDVKDYARFMHFYKNFGEYWDRLRAMLDDFEKRRKHNQ